MTGLALILMMLIMAVMVVERKRGLPSCRPRGDAHVKLEADTSMPDHNEVTSSTSYINPATDITRQSCEITSEKDKYENNYSTPPRTKAQIEEETPPVATPGSDGSSQRNGNSDDEYTMHSRTNQSSLCAEEPFYSDIATSRDTVTTDNIPSDIEETMEPADDIYEEPCQVEASVLPKTSKAHKNKRTECSAVKNVKGKHVKMSTSKPSVKPKPRWLVHNRHSYRKSATPTMSGSPTYSQGRPTREVSSAKSNLKGIASWVKPAVKPKPKLPRVNWPSLKIGNAQHTALAHALVNGFSSSPCHEVLKEHRSVSPTSSMVAGFSNQGYKDNASSSSMHGDDIVMIENELYEVENIPVR